MSGCATHAMPTCRNRLSDVIFQRLIVFGTILQVGRKDRHRSALLAHRSCAPGREDWVAHCQLSPVRRQTPCKLTSALVCPFVQCHIRRATNCPGRVHIAGCHVRLGLSLSPMNGLLTCLGNQDGSPAGLRHHLPTSHVRTPPMTGTGGKPRYRNTSCQALEVAPQPACENACESSRLRLGPHRRRTMS